mgnify:CR=1 FL=1
MTKPLSPILVEYEHGRVGFWCPGCETDHIIPVADTHSPGHNWGYNGNAASPTFTPSILVRTGHYASHGDASSCYCTWDKSEQEEFADLKCTICHSFVTDGNIQFLGDCTHALAGQAVPLPEKWANKP